MHSLTKAPNRALEGDVRRVGGLVREALSLGLLAPLNPSAQEFFGTGTYVRRMALPPNTVLEGATHRHSTILVVLEGWVDIIESTGNRTRLHAGDISPAPPMTRRAMATLEGVTFITIHHTGPVNTEDPDASALLREYLIHED